MTVYADAFVDESGQRAMTLKSSDHFIMSAAVLMPNRLAQSSALLAELRKELNRQPGHELSWKNIKGHSQRLHVAKRVGATGYLKISTVVVCKRDFAPDTKKMPDDDYAYLYTLRLLLERLSWMARGMNVVLRYTLAQIGEFPLSKLRKYEAKLRQLPTAIEWAHMDPKGGRIDQPKRLEQLQLADIAASATAAAFEKDRFGEVETRYLEQLRHRLFRPQGGSACPSYGLKIHPWNDQSQASHDWLKDWE